MTLRPEYRDGNYVPIRLSPPYIEEGVFYYEDNWYLVKPRDLLRRRINVTTPIDIRSYKSAITGTGNGTSAIINVANSSNVESASSRGTTGQQNVDELSEDEECEIADLAWENQVRTLYGFEHSEEIYS